MFPNPRHAPFLAFAQQEEPRRINPRSGRAVIARIVFKAPDGSKHIWQADSTYEFSREEIERGMAAACTKFFEAMGCEVIQAEYLMAVGVEVQ